MEKIKKIISVVVISITLVITHEVIASMQSTNYKIWLDTLGSSGGSISSGTHSMDTSITAPSGPVGTSNNFGELSGFSPIENEPTVGFNISAVNLDFGELSPGSTAYASHSFSAYTNARYGYKIKIYGESLHSADHIISPIGKIAVSAESGTEQFGINLMDNTVPEVGLNPFGGVGHASANYNEQNMFAYNEGDVIAYAPVFSYQTDFTTSVIVNISPYTPAGTYNTEITYEFIPVF